MTSPALPPAERDEGQAEPGPERDELAPAERSALFEDFDRYLSRHPPLP